MGKYIVLGASGFVGKNLVEFIKKENHTCIEFIGRSDTRPTSENLYFVDFEDANHVEIAKINNPEFPKDIDVVFNCLGYNGGIEFQGKHDIYERNVIMNMNALRFCRDFLKPKKVISFVASCAYPGHLAEFTESQFLEGEPHHSVEQHAFAKRHLFLTSYYFNDVSLCEFSGRPPSIQFISVCPPTLFGSHDKFNANSKVVGALIYKILQAKANNDDELKLLGTGEERRQLLYIQDFLEAIWTYKDSFTYKHLNNIESSIYPTIRELAYAIADIVDFRGDIWFDMNAKGVHRKYAKSIIYPPVDKTPLYKALEKTINHAKDRLNIK